MPFLIKKAKWKSVDYPPPQKTPKGYKNKIKQLLKLKMFQATLKWDSDQIYKYSKVKFPFHIR